MAGTTVFDETDAPTPEAPPPDLAEAARRYAQARLDRLFLEANRVKPLKETEARAAADFLAACANSGASSIRVDVEDTIEVAGKTQRVPLRYTMSPKRTRFPLLKLGKEAAIAALKRSKKYAYLVTESFNTSTLGSLLKEFEDAGTPLPPTLAEVMEVGERYDVSMVKSGKA